MGHSHEFEYDGWVVEIRIQKVDQADRGEGYDNVAECRHWKKVAGKNVPASYRIHKVDILVNIPEENVLPKKVLELNPNQDHLIDNELQKYFEFLLNICGLSRGGHSHIGSVYYVGNRSSGMLDNQR